MEEVAINPGFWRDKRVLLTGHTGFKGSWCSIWLQRLGASVQGYALAPETTPDLYSAAGVGARMASRFADVRNREAVRAAFEETQPEIVLHMAAQPLVRASYEAPVDTYAANVVGTANVVDAASRCAAVRAVVVLTSDKCYDLRGATGPRAEADPLGGSDPYSASKAGAELITASLRASLFGGGGRAASSARVATARAGNTLGGGDWARDRLLPDLISSFIRGTPARVRNPGAIRPWQHVLDPLRGYLVLAQRLFEASDENARERYAQGWNFGPADAETHPVAWLADAAASRWGAGARWEADAGAHPHEASELQLDSTRAQRELGWRARLSVDEALDWTVAWYRRFADGADARTLVDADIERYDSLVRA
ncbi:MAG TPA: CDP-glucose 4,6-dehydratase [Candidatus Eremiobacteraceae bacterium]|nr:CDP-glucose 4,6-dehydratase [Candidatus Eremiobacteraceae bacterium]